MTKRKIIKWFKRILYYGFLLLILSLIIGFTYEQVSRKAFRKNFHPPGELITLSDRNLHYVKRGEGTPTVVFEAGLDAQGHLAWKYIQDQISKETTTLSYDRAGILWSENHDQPKTLENMTSDLVTLLEKSNCPKPYILVGHSFAGVTLRKYINDHQEDIQGIVFVDVSHPDQMNRFPDEVKSLMKPPPAIFMKFLNWFGINRIISQNNNIKDTSNYIVNELLYKSMDGIMGEMNNIETIAKDANEYNSFDSIPLAIITGASPTRNDIIEDKELAQKMGEIWKELQKELLHLSSNSKQVLAKNSGHYVQNQEPGLVIESIQEMIGQKPN